MATLIDAVEAAIAYFEKRNIGGEAPELLEQLRQARDAANPVVLRRYTVHAYPADRKIAVIKAVRAATGLGLGDTVDLIRVLPFRFDQTIKDDYQGQIDHELKEAGALFFSAKQET